MTAADDPSASTLFQDLTAAATARPRKIQHVAALAVIGRIEEHFLDLNLDANPSNPAPDRYEEAAAELRASGPHAREAIIALGYPNALIVGNFANKADIRAFGRLPAGRALLILAVLDVLKPSDFYEWAAEADSRTRRLDSVAWVSEIADPDMTMFRLAASHHDEQRSTRRTPGRAIATVAHHAADRARTVGPSLPGSHRQK